MCIKFLSMTLLVAHWLAALDHDPSVRFPRGSWAARSSAAAARTRGDDEAAAAGGDEAASGPRLTNFDLTRGFDGVSRGFLL